MGATSEATGAPSADGGSAQAPTLSAFGRVATGLLIDRQSVFTDLRASRESSVVLTACDNPRPPRRRYRVRGGTMRTLPSGTVTFLFTAVTGETVVGVSPSSEHRESRT